ncbi:MAG TPA: hypothetical protein VKU02_15835 [Gemmataceae bacterium]|nr:hypothetical protein [Gemmataceae bacterium]
MNLPEFLTRWSAILALALYVVGLTFLIDAKEIRARLAWARRAWTAGCLLFLVHVACAFQFYHHWSHGLAYAVTAQQTAEVVGVAWGGGLYANYVFTLVWAAEVIWWWGGLDRYGSQPRILKWAVQGFLGFMAFNATVVFGTGTARWLGVAATLFLTAVMAVSIQACSRPRQSGG